MSDLDARLLKAHASGDTETLVSLYKEASEKVEDADRSAFYLTHAYIFALEIGHPDAPALRQRLIDAGRESPLPPPRPPLS